jgi:ABC-type phosphate transport system ATPase subunit
MERLQRNLVTARPEPRPESAPPRQARQPASGAPLIDVHGLSVWYDDFKAVTDVSLSIPEREITAFIGSSGSGKTTVLRALNRLNDLIPSARVDGDVEYRGENLYGPDVSPVAVRRRYTIVVVTHDMQQAARVSDRTAFFSVLANPDSDTRTGTLIEYGRTARIFEDPHDSRTQAYVTGRVG